MVSPLTIQGELRLPVAFMHNKHLDELEQQLVGYGLLPAQVEYRRWRMDTDSPGGYILTFSVVLPPAP